MRNVQITGICQSVLVLLMVLLAQVLQAADASGLGELRVGRLMPHRQGYYRGTYPGALESLLKHVRETTLAQVVPEPVDLRDFQDPKLMELPFVYANFADRNSWEFTAAEARQLTAYLKRGGLLFIDAGITAAFLREDRRMGQHHSYAEWDSHPELEKAFAKLFPKQAFKPLKRSDPLFSAFYKGLPDSSKLPESVRSYTLAEKWPDGTYATLVLTVEGRPAVITTPIIAMGWGRNTLGQWNTTIRFRILEDSEGLTDYVQNASYSGRTVQVKREDGGQDMVFCETQATPSWVREPTGKIRMFRYYGSPEINEFAHQFYTRLGTNILVYALTK